MSSLNFIKQQKEIMTRKNKIDFTEINGNVIEYTITASLIEQIKQAEKEQQQIMNEELKKKLSKKGLNIKGINQDKVFKLFMENFEEFDVQQEVLNKNIAVFEEFVYSFEKAPSKQEVLDYMEQELGKDFRDISYKIFIDNCYKEYAELIAEFTEPHEEEQGK